MTDPQQLSGTLLEESCLTLEQFLRVCAVSREWVVYRVEEGLLSAHGAVVTEWRFSSYDLRRARRMHALERDFVPELAALMADLQEEVARLRERLAHAGR